jgi:LmbE family N-acetylglucosaminyl deacetylase
MDRSFASLAFHWAGRENRYPDQLTGGVKIHRTEKLYYVTGDFTLPGRQPVTVSPVTTCIDIKEQLETKIAAFKIHETQSPLASMFEQSVRRRGPVEMFHLAASIDFGPAAQETDLFDGVRPD